MVPCWPTCIHGKFTMGWCSSIRTLVCNSGVTGSQLLKFCPIIGQYPCWNFFSSQRVLEAETRCSSICLPSGRKPMALISAVTALRSHATFLRGVMVAAYACGASKSLAGCLATSGDTVYFHLTMWYVQSAACRYGLAFTNNYSDYSSGGYRYQNCYRHVSISGLCCAYIFPGLHALVTWPKTRAAHARHTYRAVDRRASRNIVTDAVLPIPLIIRSTSIWCLRVCVCVCCFIFIRISLTQISSQFHVSDLGEWRHICRFFRWQKMWRITFVTFLDALAHEFFFNFWRFLSHHSRKTSHFGPAGTKLFWTGRSVTIRLGLKQVFLFPSQSCHLSRKREAGRLFVLRLTLSVCFFVLLNRYWGISWWIFRFFRLSHPKIGWQKGRQKKQKLPKNTKNSKNEKFSTSATENVCLKDAYTVNLKKNPWYWYL